MLLDPSEWARTVSSAWPNFESFVIEGQCEGLAVKDETHLLTAESADEFVTAIKRLWNDDSLAQHLAEKRLGARDPKLLTIGRHSAHRRRVELPGLLCFKLKTSTQIFP